eukprot:gene11152-23312_t
MIFYPAVKDPKDKTLSEDDRIYNLFLQEITKLGMRDSVVDGQRFPDDLSRAGKKNIFENRSLLEKVIYMQTDCPVEIVHKKRVAFGNYVKTRDDGRGIIIRLASGTEVNVDIGQIISCWDLLGDEDIPVSLEDWARVATDALTILGDMSPRKSDLQEFWHLVSQRSSAIPVDSLDLSVYIFQERRFRAWINPDMSTGEAGVRALTAAQRYAAALLLYNDDFHFKRRPSRVAESSDIEDQDELQDEDNDEDIEEHDDNTVAIIEGGYKVLDEGLTVFREGEVFAKYFNERLFQIQQLELKKKKKNNDSKDGETDDNEEEDDDDEDDSTTEPFRAGCITRQLRALEMYAMSPQGMEPPSTVKHILKRLEQPKNPLGATNILQKMKHSTSKRLFSSSPDKAPVRGGSSSVTPWSSSELEAAQSLFALTEEKRKELLELSVRRIGKKGPNGRMDYRGNYLEHPPICVDSRAATFFDDAFSISPETGELLVHVVDVGAVLRRFPTLQETARERISSTFLPSGPIHMLPPQALEGLKMSSSSPNEVITVALTVDSDTGKLLGYRIFPSVIGPVYPIDIETADELLAGVGVQAGSPVGAEKSVKAGYSDEVVRDLLRTERIVRRVIEKQPWVDAHFSAGNARTINLDKRTGTYEQYLVEKTPANRMVNALLTMYSNASYEYCSDREIPVPLAWENRDRLETNRARRFATQPLRSWMAQLQQKQLRAALKMELALSRKECAMAVSHHNSKKQQISPLQNRGREQMLFESFEAHCANLLSSGGTDVVVVTAEGVGRGGVVRLKEFQIEGILHTPIAKGQRVKAKVIRIIPENRSVFLELVV